MAAVEAEVFEGERYGQKLKTIEQVAAAWLVDWSFWNRSDEWLGLPRQSATEHANTGGVMRGSPRAPSDMSDSIARTDRAVASLGLRHRSILRRVIHLVYERSTPIEGVAHQLHMSVSRARATLGRAQRAVFRARQAD